MQCTHIDRTYLSVSEVKGSAHKENCGTMIGKRLASDQNSPIEKKIEPRVAKHSASPRAT